MQLIVAELACTPQYYIFKDTGMFVGQRSARESCGAKAKTEWQDVVDLTLSPRSIGEPIARKYLIYTVSTKKL